MEVRIAGINIPVNKHVGVALTAIFGIGRSTAQLICERSAIRQECKVNSLDESEIEQLRNQVSKFTIEGELRREIAINIKRKMDIGSYEGMRHRRGLPLKARTKTNAKTAKRRGKRKKS